MARVIETSSQMATSPIFLSKLAYISRNKKTYCVNIVFTKTNYAIAGLNIIQTAQRR